jgi:predicted kinase
MRQTLTIICGNAGTGKTTLGRQLAAEKDALFLDIDTVSERLVRAGLAQSGRDQNDRDSLEYKATYRAAIHETLFAIADENLSHHPCIVVAPFTQERRDPDFPRTVETRLHCPVVIVFVWCEEAERKTRITERGNPRDVGKLEAWTAYSAHGRDPEPRPPFPHQFVDTTSRSG